jgi:uncharacterized membrane protein YedE/YeeE
MTLTMDMWLYPLVGGVLIGLAASLLLLLQGRIFGVTGIISGALFSGPVDRKWRLAIILGLMSGSALVYLVNPNLFNYNFDSSYLMMAIAGLLVGFGTQLGSGCTSGHGICGLPRLSMRSIVAVGTFMFTGIVTVYIVKHILVL